MTDTPPTFRPISPNPYIVGNPVRDPNMFFGREAEFEFVRKRFLDTERGGLLVFCGERRSGKTSILFQILERRLSDDFIPVLLDMQSMAIKSEAEFLSRISDEISSVLESEGVPVVAPHFDGMQEPSLVFRDFIKKVLRAYPGKKLVLMFDEYELFENKIDTGILSEQLLHMLSNLMETLSVYLVFTGSQHIEKRQRDYWRILSRSLFRAVSYLQKDDALRLIRQPVKGRVEYAPGVDEAIYRLTAGQPFYTQALCQNLVDQLNETRTNVATREILDAVVKDVVNNPYPQMVFIWEGLERDEKIVSALLAEALTDHASSATAAELKSLVDSRKYPLDIDEARIATALAGLFKAELLFQDGDAPHRYSFRMDIWRHWIRVMHSTWQVMRELGMKRRHRRVRPVVWVSGGLAAAALLIVAVVNLSNGRGNNRTKLAVAGAAPPSTVRVKITIPANAELQVDGFPTGGRGQPYDRRIEVGTTRQFRVWSRGYADSTFHVTPGSADTLMEYAIAALRPLFGTFRINTEPAGAAIFVDGEPSSANVRKQAGITYTIAASHDGYESIEVQREMLPDTTLDVPLRLERMQASLRVIAIARRDAEIYIDGTFQGRGEVRRTVKTGPHQIKVKLASYVDVDTTVTIRGPDPVVVPITLRVEPAGMLEVRTNNYFKRIRIDNQRERGVGNNWTVELTPGSHTIEIDLPEESFSDTLQIHSGVRTIYDANLRRVIDEIPL